jgi:opacity protein-like surface antigen
MKKLISILVLFLSHYPALANHGDIKAPSFSGFYINPNIAYVRTNSDIVWEADNSGTNHQEYNADGSDYIGGVSLGYGKLYKDKYYLGIDLSADINPAEVSEIDVSTNATNDYNRHTKIREKIGATLKAGYTIGHSLLLYIKAGAALMNQQYAQEYRRKADENDGVPVMVWIDEPPDHGAKDLWQAKVGIGFEEQLNPNTTLNIEVDYIDDSNSLFFYSTGTNNFTVNTKQVKYMLGLSYYF